MEEVEGVMDGVMDGVSDAVAGGVSAARVNAVGVVAGENYGRSREHPVTVGYLTDKTLEKFEGDAEWFDGLMERVAGGERLKEVCESLVLTPWRVMKWIYGDEGRAREYERALRVGAAVMAHEVVGIADGADEDGVGVAKLRIETRMKMMGKWDRGRYGDREVVGNGGGVTVVVNMGLVGEVATPGGVFENGEGVE